MTSDKAAVDCFVQLPRLASTRPGSQVTVHSRKSSLTRSTATPGRRASMRPLKSMDFSIIDNVVAERRNLDISVLSAPDRKTHFPIPRRSSVVQTAKSVTRTREIKPENAEIEVKKPVSEVDRLLKSLNWVPVRLESFFPFSAEDEKYRGQGKTSYTQGNEVLWPEVHVLDYDASTGKYLIRLLTLRPGLTKHVQRVNLMFAGEENSFPDLLKTAYALKKEAENRLNVDYFISKVMSGKFDLRGAPVHFVQKIVSFIGKIYEKSTENRKNAIKSDLNAFFDYAYLREMLLKQWNSPEIADLRISHGVTDFTLVEFPRKNHEKCLSNRLIFNKKPPNVLINKTIFGVLGILKAHFLSYFDEETIFEYPLKPFSWVEFQQISSKKPLNFPQFPMNFRHFHKFQLFRIQKTANFIEKNWLHEAGCKIFENTEIGDENKEKTRKIVELMNYELIFEEINRNLRSFLTFLDSENSIFWLNIDYFYDGKSNEIEIKINPNPRRILVKIEEFCTELIKLATNLPTLQDWKIGKKCVYYREITEKESSLKEIILEKAEKMLNQLEIITKEIEFYGKKVGKMGQIEDIDDSIPVLTALERLENRLSESFSLHQNLLLSLQNEYKSGLFLLKSSSFRVFLLNFLHQNIALNSEKLHFEVQKFTNSIHVKCNQCILALTRPISSLDELIDSIMDLNRIKSEDLEKIKGEIDMVLTGIVGLKWVWRGEIVTLLSEINSEIRDLERIIGEKETEIEKNKLKFARKLEQDRENLKGSIQVLMGRFQDFTQLEVSFPMEKWLVQASETALKLINTGNEIEVARQKINFKEKVMKIDISQHYALDKHLNSAVKVLDFVLKAAEISTNLQIWKNSLIKKLDPSKMNAIITEFLSNFSLFLPKLPSSFQEIATFLCSEMTQFRSFMNIIDLFQEESLKDRHWKLIYDILQLNHDVYFDLSTVISKNAHISPIFDRISSIITTAKQELSLETHFKRFKSLFHSLHFHLIPHTDTFFLSDANEIREKISEFREILGLIGKSECVSEVRQQAVEWGRKMDTLETLLFEWSDAQREISALEQFFDSERGKMGFEPVLMDFNRIKTRLNKILTEIEEQPEVLRCREMHISYFQSCAQQLKVCRSQVQDSTDGVFYGLSDSQVMDLLGSADMY